MVSDRNLLRGTLFSKSYARANRAIKSGFYLEAISLAESLMLDRLTTILEAELEDDFSKFSVGKACNNLISHKVTEFDKGLWLACQDWSRLRNQLSHKVSSLKNTAELSWHLRLRLAKETAIEGMKLVNRCSREVQHHRL